MRTSAGLTTIIGMLGVTTLTLLMPTAVIGQGVTTPYPVRAPIDQYRMTADAEIAMARSAATPDITADAEILVLGASGYESVAKGKNGFVCLVERSWANDFGNSDFWNPKNRAPVCYNPAAARSVLPGYLTRTKWVLAGVSEVDMARRSQSESTISAPDVGSMAYMLSREGYLGDNVKGPWHPHLMFLLPTTPASAWGANAAKSPVALLSAPGAPIAVFLVPVSRWSDGSPDSTPQ